MFFRVGDMADGLMIRCTLQYFTSSPLSSLVRFVIASLISWPRPRCAVIHDIFVHLGIIVVVLVIIFVSRYFTIASVRRRCARARWAKPLVDKRWRPLHRLPLGSHLPPQPCDLSLDSFRLVWVCLQRLHEPRPALFAMRL